MVKLRAFIFASFMHLYWDYTHTQEVTQLWTIFLKLLIFWKNHISPFVPPCIMYFEIHITMNYFCVACVYAYFNGNDFTGSFGIYADEPMQSWIACCVASCIIIIGSIICGQSLQPQVCLQKHHILHIYVHMFLVYAHALVSKYNLYF